MSRFLSIVAMTALIASGTAARAAEEPVSRIENPAMDFSHEVTRLLAAHPDGGKALEEALTALVQDQPDPAASVSQLIALLGARPTPGQIAAAGNAIRRAANYTVPELQQAIARLIVAADDPVVMAMNALAISPYLDDAMQSAVGLGLAKAATTLKENGKAAIAGVIDAEIATAADSPLQKAYIAERGDEVFPTRSPVRTQTQTKNPLDPPDDFEPQTGSPS